MRPYVFTDLSVILHALAPKISNEAAGGYAACMEYNKKLADKAEAVNQARSSTGVGSPAVK